MANVLPREIKKQTQKEYSLRFWSLVLLFISALTLFAGVLLVPSYLVSIAEESGKIDQIKFIKEYQATKIDNSKRVLFDRAVAELKIFNKEDNVVSLENILNQILFAKDEAGGIKVTGVFYDKSNKTKETQITSMTLSGISNTRNDLLSFTNALDKQSLFEGADLPVSSLKKTFDIPFSLKVQVIQNK